MYVIVFQADYVVFQVYCKTSKAIEESKQLHVLQVACVYLRETLVDLHVLDNFLVLIYFRVKMDDDLFVLVYEQPLAPAL